MQTVPQIIASQIGSAFVMMGVKREFMVGSDDALTFKLGRGAQHKITHMRVTLRPDDTYTVTAYQYRNLEMKKIMESDMVYADNLKPVIGRMTGFAMSL